MRLLALLLLTCSVAQAGAIDDYVRAEMMRRHIPGLSVAIVRNGKIVKRAGYGLADVERNEAVVENTRFEIASMTKQFTAAGILLLAEEGKLSIEDPISKFIDGTPESWRGITLRQLMNHTSGLRDDWDEETPYFVVNDTNEKFVRALEQSPLKFTPGHAFSYSCGPFLLGLVIEKVSGKPYAQFMRERIFVPLKMRSTSVNDPAAVVPHRASGYRWIDGQLTAGVPVSAAAEARGDVGISTTAADLLRWNAALEGPALLSARSRQSMFTPARLSDGSAVPYGLGWFIQPYRGHRLIHHPGGFRTGFNTAIERFVDDRLTIIVLTNLQSGRARTLGYGVARFFSRDFRPIVATTPRPEPDPAYAEIVRRTLLEISAGTIAKSKFDALHLPGPLEEARELLRDIGDVTYVDRIVPAHAPDIFGKPIVEVRLYTVRIGGNEMIWQASFTRDGSLEFLDFDD